MWLSPCQSCESTHSLPASGGNWPGTPKPVCWWQTAQFCVKTRLPITMGSGAAAVPPASRAIPGDTCGVEDVHLEPAAVPEEITGAKKRQGKESDDQPGRKQLCAFARPVRLAQELVMLLHEIRFLRVSICRLVGHGSIVGVRLPAANSPASGKEDTPPAPWHPRSGTTSYPGRGACGPLRPTTAFDAGLARDSPVLIKVAIRRHVRAGSYRGRLVKVCVKPICVGGSQADIREIGSNAEVSQGMPGLSRK